MSIMHRYHPSDPRSSMNGYEGSLTLEEEAALEQLTSEVEGLDLRVMQGDYGEGCLGGNHAVEPLKLLLLRFLRGNAFSVSKALAQLTKCVEYRAQHPVDLLLSMSPREVLGCDPESFDRYYPRWLMGFDRLGRPIMASQYGSLRLWDMIKITTVEQMAQLHAREQELLLRLIRRRSLEGGSSSETRGNGGEGGRDADDGARPPRSPHIVDTVVIVVDTAGLTLRHVTRDFMRLFKMRSEVDQLLYPEMLGKVIIINTPSLFSYVYSMLAPMLDARTRSKIAIVARSVDWEKALLEIADPDQISPDYGGTGPRRANLPPIADAFLAAGNPGGVNHVVDSSGRALPQCDNGDASVAEDDRGGEGGGDDEKSSEEMMEDGVSGDPGGGGDSPRSRVFCSSGRAVKVVVPLVEEQEKGGETGGWFFTSWGIFDAAWWGGGGRAGRVADMESGAGRGERKEDECRTSLDEEEFYDALTELDYHAQRDSWDGVLPSSSTSCLSARENSTRPAHESGHGNNVSSSSGGGDSKTCWRKSWRQASWEDDDEGAQEWGVSRAGSLASRQSRQSTAAESRATGAARMRKDASTAVGKWGALNPAPCMFAALAWCCKPALRVLGRKSVDQLVRWLCIANVVSAMLAVACIVVGTFSVSTSWLGAVLGWQWGAITAVCLGSLLLLLALMGTGSARMQNRFTLLGFAAVEGVVACGTLLMGAWCLALASGSARVSDLTWKTLDEERNPSMTKEEFLDGARDRLVALGWSGLILSIFSILGPCLLAVALSRKIRQVEREEGALRNGDGKRFQQLKRWFQEINALLTAFACVCTGYGGYGLSFTISLGLAASAASTYLMLAGGYILLLAGVVGAWAASSSRPDAFRLHFGALLPAGALYVSLTVAQLVRAKTSNAHVKEAWPTLNPEGQDLSIVQAKIRTILIVGGVLSAVTFMLVVAAVVSSEVTRNALLRIERRGDGSSFRLSRRHKTRFSRGEKVVAVWALALAATSTFLDGSFAVFSAWLAKGEHSVWLVAFWRAMGRGDRRYVEGDTLVVATAIIVAAVIGPGALLYAWSVYCRKGFRFSVGILVCSASLYTQVLRYVTKAEGQTASEENPAAEENVDTQGGGTYGVFIAASVALALIQVAGASAVLLYNIRGMSKRVHAAEVQYEALLIEHKRLEHAGKRRQSSLPGTRRARQEKGTERHRRRSAGGRWADREDAAANKVSLA